MAAKYWYIAGNGSGLWSTAANWYNGPGGTLGTTTIPTAADDVYLTSGSGSGTLTIATPATCLSLNCTGFTGTLAGTSTLAFINNITLSSSMGLTYTGTATLGAGTCLFTSAGKTVTFNITINNASAIFALNDNLTMTPTAVMTLTSGGITYASNLYVLSPGLFVSTGAVARTIQLGQPMTITGSGTVWNVTGTLFGYNNPGYVTITNASGSAKTITHTVTSATGGYDYKTSFTIGGGGTGGYTMTGNFYDVYCYNTGGASIAFGTSTIYQNLDFGELAVGITPNMNWNNGATTITFNSDYGALYLNQFMSITASAAISITNPGIVNFVIFTNSYSKLLTANVSINGAGANSGLLCSGDLLTTGVITLTAGNLQGNDVYCGSFSSSNSNGRLLNINDLYLSGTGSLTTVTVTTNAGFSFNNAYVTNGTATAKSITLNTIFYPQLAVYLGGSGSGAISISAGTSNIFGVYVTNTGGATVSFTTAAIAFLEFSAGTNAIWSNTASQTLTIGGNLTIASSAGNPVLTPSLVFNGTYPSIYAGYYTVFVTLNGKSLVTGAVTLNDTAFSANNINYILDGLSTSAGFTVTAAQGVTINGPVSCSTLTITSVISVTFNSTLTISGVLSLANNAYDNSITVVGNASMTILNHLAIGTATFNGTLNATTSISLSNAAGTSAITHYGVLTTPSFTITNGNLTSYSTLNVSGSLGLTTGSVIVNGAVNYNLGGFASSGSGIRTISMGRGIWTLSGIGNPWSISATNLFFDAGFTTINITDSSGNTLGFAGGSLSYYTLQWNRGGATGSCSVASGNNTFVNLIDLGTSAHSLLFGQGTTQTIGHFVATGSPGNLITLNSVNGVNGFNLIKSPNGLVSCDYLNIQHSLATPSTGTWYAGANSINNQAISTAGSGWIFTPPSARELGSTGVG